MGFREFDRGMTADQIEQQRRHEANIQLMDMQRDEELILSILRPLGDTLPPRKELFELWKDSKR